MEVKKLTRNFRNSVAVLEDIVKEISLTAKREKDKRRTAKGGNRVRKLNQAVSSWAIMLISETLRELAGVRTM